MPLLNWLTTLPHVRRQMSPKGARGLDLPASGHERLVSASFVRVPIGYGLYKTLGFEDVGGHRAIVHIDIGDSGRELRTCTHSAKAQRLLLPGRPVFPHAFSTQSNLCKLITKFNLPVMNESISIRLWTDDTAVVLFGFLASTPSRHIL